MRRLPALVLIVTIAALLAACSASATPGWTYAPAASTAPAASGGASGAPASGAPSAGPSTAAASPSSPSVTAAPSSVESAGASGAAGLTVTARTNAATSGFDPATLETAAGTAFTLTFDNEDNTAQHNLVLFNPDGSKVAIQGDTNPFTGPSKRTYQVPALTAGGYSYKCEVHPTTMIGTLTVK
jgi:plastocyanin